MSEAQSDKRREKRLGKKACEIVTRWQAILGLHNWQISVLVEPVAGGGGRCSWVPGYRTAEITVDPSLSDVPKADLESILLHEVCHLLLAPIRDEVFWTYDAASYAWKTFERHTETVVDELASIFARLVGSDVRG